MSGFRLKLSRMILLLVPSSAHDLVSSAPTSCLILYFQGKERKPVGPMVLGRRGLLGFSIYVSRFRGERCVTRNSRVETFAESVENAAVNLEYEHAHFKETAPF